MSDQTFELKDPNEVDEKGEAKPDEEKSIVIKEIAPAQTVGETTLAELKKALVNWEETEAQAKIAIPKLKEQIKQAEALFTK